jgi:hypothetical protein
VSLIFHFLGRISDILTLIPPASRSTPPPSNRPRYGVEIALSGDDNAEWEDAEIDGERSFVIPQPRELICFPTQLAEEYMDLDADDYDDRGMHFGGDTRHIVTLRHII